MKSSVAKKFLIKKLVKNGSILFVLIIITVGSFYINSKNNADIETIKTEISNLNNQVTQSNQLFEEAEANLKKFAKIPKNELPTKDGYSAGYMRVKELKAVFNKLKEAYRFNKLELNIQEIKPSQSITADEFEAFEGLLDIKFEGVSDEYVMSFINDLDYLLPGKMQIIELNIKKESNITNENIAKYSVDKSFKFVSGDMKLNWLSFKTKVK